MRIILTVVKSPHEGRQFTFEEHDNFIVGRAKFAQFRLPVRDKFFSRVHFMVEVNPPLCRLMDMHSTNGVAVNRRKVTTADLKDGDLIKAGQTVIRVSMQDREPGSRDAFLVSEAPPPSAEFEHVALVEPVPEPPGPVPPPRVARSQRATVLELRPPGPAHPPALCKVCAAPLADHSSPRDVDASTLAPVCPICRLKIRDQPQLIAGYEIVRELGRGGMGVVYLALRQADWALMALKTIQPANAGTKLQTERFLREARILSQLDHPHVVVFREMGESNGLLFFAMDYVPGNDLAVVQKKHGGPLPITRAVDLTCQMLTALEYAHGKGFVHRDIKPANILLEERGGRTL